MSASLRPTRLEVSDRFPMLGFSIRNDGSAARAEVALASDPALFRGENKEHRSAANFYSSRATGNVALARGETVYIVPPEVLARFVGQERLYFGLASGADGAPFQVDVRPNPDSPYISIKGLSARSMTRVRILPSRQQRAAGYNGVGKEALEWTGDAATPGMAAMSNGAAPAAPAAPAYDDGFGPMPTGAAPAVAPAPAPRTAPAPAAQGMEVDVADDRGIEGGAYAEDDGQILSAEQAWSLGTPSPEYSGASRFAPATSFQAMSSPRTISRIVIHITDAPSTSSTVNAFTSPAARVSSHYLVGQDGEVVQFVLENDVAYHANRANGDSIGIEHVAIKQGGVTYHRANGTPVHYNYMPPSDAQYCASAALVSYLCDKYGIPEDRVHILGHSEADTRTSHRSCPGGADWNWDHFMQLVSTRTCSASDGTGTSQSLGSVAARRIGAAKPRPRAITRGLGSDGATLEVKYRMFIPSPLIDAPTAVFGGDGRGFSYSGGTSRGELTANVRMTPGGGIAGIDLVNRCWGESTEYNSGDTHAVAGKPSWWLDKNDGASATNRATLAASDDNLRIYAGAPGTTRAIQATVEQAALITIEAAGSLPLSSVAPAIDADVSLLIRASGDRVEVKVQGEHDGFPCHELYVNGQRIYSYDPVAAGSSPDALMPPMDISASTGWISIGAGATSQGLADDDLRLAPPPQPRARAMDGGADAAIAIGGFVLQTIRDSAGDVTWELDQFPHLKHPNDVTPSPMPAFSDAATIRLDSWPVAGGLVDDISAWFSVDWQFNGRSLGNIRIGNIGTNDAIGWGLHVRAQIMDDNILYQPGQCAALRLRLHYRFSRSIGSDVIGVTEIHLYGDGTYEQSSQWLQASALGMASAQARRRPLARSKDAGNEDMPLPAPPAPRARAMDGGVSAAIAIGGFIVESIRDSVGDVTWDLDQFAHIKHPDDTAPSPAAAYRDATTIRLDSWPVAGGLIDDISAWFSIDWQYNGKSLGNIRIGNIGTNDAVGWGLQVRAQIMDDNILYQPNQCAALRLRFHYRFNRSIGSDVIAVTEVHLYGDGTYEQSSQWLQASALSLEANLPRTTGSNGQVSWDLMQYPDMKNAQSQVAATGRLTGEPVSLADWPYLDEPNTSRTQAAIDIAWAYDGSGAVGGVRITPGAVSSAGARSLVVTATIEDAEGSPSCAALLVTLRYAFRHPTDGEQVAVTRVTLYGNGKAVRNSEWLQAQPRLAA